MPHRPRIGRTILLVEDSALLRGMLVEFLENRGYVVLAAGDPGTALELGHQVPIDLLLTDGDLHAEHTGASLALRLRARTPEVKLVLMTGALDWGAGSETDLFDCVLEKPFPLRKASEVIRCLLAG